MQICATAGLHSNQVVKINFKVFFYNLMGEMKLENCIDNIYRHVKYHDHQHKHYAHDNHHHHHHDDHLETQCTSASVRPTTKSNAVHRKFFLFAAPNFPSFHRCGYFVFLLFQVHNRIRDDLQDRCKACSYA